jgi:hypothetical protein
VQNRTPRSWEMADTEGWKAKRAPEERKRGLPRKKGQEAPLGEARSSEEREPEGTRRAVLSGGQSEQGGKVFWDTEQGDRHPTGRWRARIASQPLCP